MEPLYYIVITLIAVAIYALIQTYIHRYRERKDKEFVEHVGQVIGGLNQLTQMLQVLEEALEQMMEAHKEHHPHMPTSEEYDKGIHDLEDLEEEQHHAYSGTTGLGLVDIMTDPTHMENIRKFASMPEDEQDRILDNCIDRSRQEIDNDRELGSKEGL